MVDLADIKKTFDKDFSYAEETRQNSSNDWLFYWVTHWDDGYMEDVPLAYKGQFDIIRKAGRDIDASLTANPVQIDFSPVDEDRDDAADLADGLYRSDDNHNATIEAHSGAKTEAYVCGVGAWERYTEYESYADPDNLNQVVRCRPIHEANNTVFWDANARMLDKSDARHCSILLPYTPDGYKELVNSLTGEELDEIDPTSFSQPEQSYTFQWYSDDLIYVVKHYKRELIEETVVVFTDPFGGEITLIESEIADVMDEMIDAGYEVSAEKKWNRYKVTCYLASGADIIHEFVVAGEHIPVVPVFGEHAYIDGVEHWEGIVRLAKDPQRLRNFQMSYLADIVSQSPREKPIFSQGQISGLEKFYSQSGADDNYPYALMNDFDAQGNPLPMQPMGYLKPAQVPPALAASIQLSREAVEDVANPGVPQDIADPDMSGKAAYAFMAKLDKQTAVYQKHFKHAKRRDAEIWVSMAKEVYDVPRKTTLTLPDGTRKVVQMMETILDAETGEPTTLNDLSNTTFNVHADIGPAYGTLKEQNIERLTATAQSMDAADPMRSVIIYKMLMMMDGDDFADIRKHAKKDLILKGVIEPETDEEKQAVLQAQQAGQQPSADMLLAMAEMQKAEADKMREQRENIKFQMQHQLDIGDLQVDNFKAQTDRMNTQIKAQEAGANISLKQADTTGKQLDNTMKVIELQDPRNMTTEQLFAELRGGTA